METPRHNPEAQASIDAWNALDRKIKGYRAINDRQNDGIEVSLFWKVGSKPPEFMVSVYDFKLNTIYELIPASFENYKEIYAHPMSILADFATQKALEESGLESE